MNNESDNMGIESFKSQLLEMSDNMKLISQFSIVYGIILCLGIIPAVFGIPIIKAGKKLKESANLLKSYATTPDEDTIKNALINMHKFYKIYKKLIIFVIVLSALMILGMILMFYFISNEILKELI